MLKVVVFHLRSSFDSTRNKSVFYRRLYHRYIVYTAQEDKLQDVATRACQRHNFRSSQRWLIHTNRAAENQNCDRDTAPCSYIANRPFLAAQSALHPA